MENIVVKIEPPDFFDGDANGEMFGTTSSDMFETSTDLFGTSSNSLNAEIKFENETEIKQEPSEYSTEMEYNSLGEFCFENDHPALKNNTDYKRLIQVSFISIIIYLKYIVAISLTSTIQNNPNFMYFN